MSPQAIAKTSSGTGQGMESSEGHMHWTRVTTTSPDVVTDAYGQTAQRRYEQLTPGVWKVTAEVGHIGQTLVFREKVSTATEVRVAYHLPTYACLFPLSGCAGSRFFGQELNDTGVLTLEPGVDLWGICPAGAEVGGISLPAPVLLHYAATMHIADAKHLSNLPRILDLPAHRTLALRRFCQSVLSNLESNHASRDSAAVQAQIEERAALLVLVAYLGRAGVRGVGRPRSSYERLTQRARDFVTSHSSDAPTLTELCEHLHVGVRTLNYAFHRSVGTSAAEYLRLIRLNNARRDLLAAKGRHDVLVSAVAARWGFWNASLFGRQYRRLFGELPSATLSQR